jgi:hypothetical protein
MSNEVLFNNLQDDIVYHANIFNYDKQFLMNLLKFNIKLDFAEYSQAKGQDLKPTIEFLKKKSREQVDLMTYAVYNEFNQLPEDLDPELVQKKVQDSKAATKALRHLFNLFTYSYEKAEEKAKVIEGSSIEAGELYANNLIACLLYWDGISMVNIDIVKLIENGAGYTGKSFKEFIFMILNNKKFDYHIQEIASHILSIDLMVNYENTFPQQEIDIPEASKELMKWTYEICIQKQRDSCLTSNLSLLLTIGENIDYFLGEFNEEFPCIRKIFELMTEADININIIYECLLCMWNISSNKKYFYFFENRDHKYIEKIVQVIRTNKIDKVARIGLMTLQNLLESQICVEILFDIKFMQTVTILLTNKWNDPVIKELLNFSLDFLEKNYKSMK